MNAWPTRILIQDPKLRGKRKEAVVCAVDHQTRITAIPEEWVIPADLGQELYEATEYIAANVLIGNRRDDQAMLKAADRIREVRARYEREVGE